MEHRFQHASATARLAIFPDGTALLSSLRSQARWRGHASGLMRDITSYADEHGLTIFLTVQAYGHPTNGLNNRELEKFYERFGFVRDARFPKPPFRMIRYLKEG